MYKLIPGTRDILPQEALLWQRMEAACRSVFSLYNYHEIRTPVVEEMSLFNRSLGETTEIVRKQMFVINNKDDNYVLRPEGTAAIVRAYIENNMDKAGGLVKLYYMGPMFRLERPQKGRQRQFHHIGCEAIGSSDAGLDVEVVSLADALLKNLSISGYIINLNNLGCAADKEELALRLRRKIKDLLPKLCADCNQRYDSNVMRILDCKNPDCKTALEHLDLDESHLCAGCRKHFSAVKTGLDSLKIAYALAPHLVRGLDYYTGTVFEITHSGLGAQDALGAGGRYDNLVKQLGGPATGSIGFAFGVERLILAGCGLKPAENKITSYIISLGDNARSSALKLLDTLRRNGISADTDYESKSLKGALRKANDYGAKFVLIIGDDELKKNTVMLKDMESGEQREVKVEDVVQELGKDLVT
ncbi:MAG: histidine--tRNA ligase [Candidatus Omnitrophota bacterium]|nr:histidine--tRNA ligase [Candidatus Omnitrophota bacterium]